MHFSRRTSNDLNPIRGRRVPRKKGFILALWGWLLDRCRWKTGKRFPNAPGTKRSFFRFRSSDFFSTFSLVFSFCGNLTLFSREKQLLLDYYWGCDFFPALDKNQWNIMRANSRRLECDCDCGSRTNFKRNFENETRKFQLEKKSFALFYRI